MKHFHRIALLGAVTFLGTTASVLAQNTAPIPVPMLAQSDAAKWRVVEVKNAPASLLAYQLDPAHNDAPRIGSQTLPPAEKREKGESIFELPGEIEQIVPLNEQKVLLIKGGNDKDILRLQELVDILDQPLRQIEVEAQIVEMTLEDARVFGIDFSSTPDNAKNEAAQLTPKVGFVRNHYMARLNALIADNRVKVISAPRITIANNFSSQLTLVDPLTITLNSPNRGDKPESESKINTTSGTLLKVVPTINSDGSITLLMDIFKEPQGTKKTPEKIGVTIIANVRDGNTVALGNLSPFAIRSSDPSTQKVPLLGDIPLVSGLFRSKTVEQPRGIFVFVTPRIIRRADETETKTPQK